MFVTHCCYGKTPSITHSGVSVWSLLSSMQSTCASLYCHL